MNRFNRQLPRTLASGILSATVLKQPSRTMNIKTAKDDLGFFCVGAGPLGGKHCPKMAVTSAKASPMLLPRPQSLLSLPFTDTVTDPTPAYSPMSLIRENVRTITDLVADTQVNIYTKKTNPRPRLIMIILEDQKTDEDFVALACHRDSDSQEGLDALPPTPF